MTKGYLLRAAIYLQIDNPDIKSSSYKGTAIYYDTPFLLQLLGFQSLKETESAKALHSSLKAQGAKFYYFPQNEAEMISILTAYQYSLVGRQKSAKTLDGLDALKYGFEDISRLKKRLPSLLEKQYGIVCRELPAYPVTETGEVDTKKVDISEKDAMEYVRLHTKHYTEENLESDVASALGIHRLRNGAVSQSIERCKALFVTTNVDFTRAFNDFYKETIGSNRVMPVITAFDLSAISWVKGGNINANLPERQLLTNSYLALQPSPEIMERCRSVLTRLEKEGKLSPEEAVSLRADRVTQHELWIEYFPTPENIDESYVAKLQEKQRQKLIGTAEAELKERFQRESKSEELLRIQEAQRNAMEFSQKKRISFVRCLKGTSFVLFSVVIVACIWGMIKSVASTERTIFLVAFILVSILSIFDTLLSRSQIIGRQIEKWANHYETKVYERKMEEYLPLLKKKPE